jgi:hypothetical protein
VISDPSGAKKTRPSKLADFVSPAVHDRT